MIKSLLIVVCILFIQVLHAQNTMNISSGMKVVASGPLKTVVNNYYLANNGAYTDTTGTVLATANGLKGTVAGSIGSAVFYNFVSNTTDSTFLRALLSVRNSATLTAGFFDAGSGNLYLRTDINPSANMVVDGVLAGSVQGLATRATSTSGSCSVTTSLSMNVTGAAMVYKWQASTDSVSWSNVPGATTATYTATVTTTSWYRCALTTNNSTYNQFTPGIKITLISSAPVVGAITGLGTVAVSATITLSNTAMGGVWSSSNTAKATVGTATGVVTGVAAGTATISYNVTNSCGSAVVTKSVTVTGGGISPITGITTVCTGSTSTLSDITAGGTWSSSNTAIATIGSASGIVTGVVAGTATITYRVSTAYVTAVVTVGSLSTPTTGIGILCMGATTAFSNSTTGGVWSSSAVAKATVGSATGIVTGVAAGSAIITYALGTGCRVTKAVTVSVTPAAIGGLNSVCRAATITLTDATTGGKWLSGSTGIALVGSSTGIVSGVSTGVAVITYSTAAGCAATKSVSVNSVSSIQGSNRICLGESATLTDSTTGGVWTSGSTLIARVGTGTGIVTGAGAGVTAISYTAGGCRATYTVTVSNLVAIAGASSVCQGQTTTLTNTLTGGRWTSSDISLATVGSSTGLVSGIAAGAVNISYTLPTGCVALKTLTIVAVSAIGGSSSICRGQTVTLTNAISGGIWSSTSGLIATIGSATGVVNGIGSGFTTISYTANGCRATFTVTVNNLAAIVGASSLCQGQTTLLTNAIVGGGWSSSDITLATVGSSTGVVSGVSSGVVIISYSLPTGCVAVNTLTVVAVSAIGGSSSICRGQTVTLTNAITGGIWSSTSGLIATIGSGTGIVNGVANGYSIISYTANGCRATLPLTVNALSAITGTTNIVEGQVVTLTTSGTGAWSSSNTRVATVGSGTGQVTGVVAGAAQITFTTTTGCAAMVTMTVNHVPAISGDTSLCVGQSKSISNPVTGGTWISGNTTIATIGSASGLIFGVTGGTVYITYRFPAGGYTVSQFYVYRLSLLTGPSSVCSGQQITLTNSECCGYFISSSSGVATVDFRSGTVTGVGVGTTVISYLLPTGCITTSNITVNPLAPISGSTNICLGDTMIVSDAISGGYWSSNRSLIASVGSSTGAVIGRSVGIATVSYTIPATGCTATLGISVNSCRQAQTAIEMGDQEFTLIPNPNKGEFTLKGTFASSKDEDATIEVVNMLGQVVYSAKATAVSGVLSEKVQIDGNLANGMYLLNLHSTNETKVFHFVLSK